MENRIKDMEQDFLAHIANKNLIDFIEKMKASQKDAMTITGIIAGVLMIASVASGFIALFMGKPLLSLVIFGIAILSMIVFLCALIDESKFVYAPFLKQQYNILLSANRDSEEFHNSVLLFKALKSEECNVIFGESTKKATDYIENNNINVAVRTDTLKIQVS